MNALSAPSEEPPDEAGSYGRSFVLGLKAAARSIFTYTLCATFVGFGALCHDLGFTAPWALLSSALVFAGPAQVISTTMLASGATLIAVALAVGLSAIRLLPMTVAFLPMIKMRDTRVRDLLLPTHFISVSLRIEAYRLVPHLPREMRIPFTSGLGAGMTISSCLGTVVGFNLAQQLPPLLGAAVLLLTPIVFLISTARGSVTISDRVAFWLALVLAPVLIFAKVELALLITAIVAGTAGYVAHRLKGRARA